MSFATILSKLLNKHTEARAAAADEYRQLVSDAAHDRSGISESRISSVLGGCGKSLNDLQHDVAAEQERLANLSIVARRDEIMAALSQNNAARMAEDKRYSDAVNEAFQSHGIAVAAIQARDRQLSDELRRIESAEQKLIATEATDRLSEIKSELIALVNQERRLANISLQSDKNVQRQRQAIPVKRAALMKERDRIRAEILASN